MYSTDEAIKQTLQDIAAMEETNAALPKIKKVVEKWSGKMLNKRFGDDLAALELPGRIYLSTCYENSWEVHYRPTHGNKYYTVLHGTKPTCRYYEQEKSFVDPDKRISTERAFAIIEAGRVERLKTITAYKEHLETWEEKKAQMDILKKQLATIANSIPYTLQDYFNMRVNRY